MKDEIIINGVTYVKKEELKEEVNDELYRIVNFSNIKWYVIAEDNESMTLLMENRLTKEQMQRCFDSRDMDEDCDIKFSRNGNNAWKDSLIRMGLNSAFLKDLDISKMIEMETTDNGETTEDYVRLLTKEETNNLPNNILRVDDKYGYWTMSAHADYSYYAWGVHYSGRVGYFSTTDDFYGARAVVKIKK